MSCMTLWISQAAVATTPLARIACSEKLNSWSTDRIASRKAPLRMSWVAVTGEDGKRHLRMRWAAQQEENE